MRSSIDERRIILAVFWRWNTQPVDWRTDVLLAKEMKCSDVDMKVKL